MISSTTRSTPEERWTRTPENFRRDLETLYASYRLINLATCSPEHQAAGRHHARSCSRRRFLAGPVPFTSRRTAPSRSIQVRARRPRGVHREKPDFGRAATFLRAAGRLQAQPALQPARVRGAQAPVSGEPRYESATTPLAREPPPSTRRRRCAPGRRGPGVDPAPRPRHKNAHDRAPARRLSHGRELGAERVGQGHDLQPRRGPDGRGRPAPSPFSRAFDPVRLPRIQAVERELAYWIDYFDKNPNERFGSDGDPSRSRSRRPPRTASAPNSNPHSESSNARTAERSPRGSHAETLNNPSAPPLPTSLGPPHAQFPGAPRSHPKDSRLTPSHWRLAA